MALQKFHLHENIMLSVFKEQAGSVEKAVLEGVMNSVDSGSTLCEVTVGEKRITIGDNGKGMTSKAVIDRYFRVVGQPPDEGEDKTFGKFRMGRGQLFTFGVNTWRTGPYELHVDLNTDWKGYDLRKVPGPKVQGCNITIDLYEPLEPYTVSNVVSLLGRWLKYVDIDVRVNGNRVSVPIDFEKWDVRTDEYVVRYADTGSVIVYNQGVHVMDTGAYRFGVGGTVVSLLPLKVNFARNDIHHDCPIWRSVTAALKKEGDRRAGNKKVPLTAYTRKRVINRILAGEVVPDAASLKLVQGVTGRWFTPAEVARISVGEISTITEAPLGSLEGDQVMQGRLAFVVAYPTLENFEVADAGKLFDILRQIPGCNWKPMQYMSLDEIRKGLNTDRAIIPDSFLTPLEKFWLDLTTACLFWVYHVLKIPSSRRRRLVVGQAVGLDGWTDGTNYIALERTYLARLQVDVRGYIKVGLLIIHELSHDGEKGETQFHGQEMLEAFHEMADDILPLFVYHCEKAAPGAASGAGYKIRRMTRPKIKLDKLADAVKGGIELLARLHVTEEEDKNDGNEQRSEV